MDVILVIVGIAMLVFTAVMICLYRETGAIPDTLCTCVFGALGGECGAMAWIRTTKERYRDRQDALEYRKYMEQKRQQQKTANQSNHGRGNQYGNPNRR